MAVLYKILLKTYFNYQLQITFSNSISNTFLNYFGTVVQNTQDM